MQKYTKQVEFNYELYRLREILKEHEEITKLHEVQEILAKSKGFKNWHDFQVVHKHQAEYFKSLNDLNENKNVYSYWRKMLDNEPIKTIKISPNEQKLKKHTFVIEDTSIDLPIFNKRVKKFWTSKEETTNLTTTDFPLSITGSSGAGKSEILFQMADDIINQNKGIIFLNDSMHFNSLLLFSHFAKKANRPYDLLFLNLIKAENSTQKNNRKTSNTINPLAMLLESKSVFEKTFGYETSQWLFPALKSYETKGERVTIKSLSAFFKLPQLLAMAQSNAWDNQTEVTSYLNSISLPLNGDLTDEEIKEISVLHTIKQVQALEVIDIFNDYVDENVFSDFPEFDFNEVFQKKKILNILFPALEKSSDRIHFIKNMIHSLIIEADLTYGNKNVFLFFIHNSNPLCFKSNKINSNDDFHQYSADVFNFEKFYFPEKFKDIQWFRWEMDIKKLDHNTYFIMKQEDPDNITKLKDYLIDTLWGRKGLEAFFKSNHRDFKELNEGSGYLLKTNRGKNHYLNEIEFDKYYFKYKPIKINEMNISLEVTP